MNPVKPFSEYQTVNVYEKQIAALQTRVNELQSNENAYERIIGPCSYQEVADVAKMLRARVAELEKEAERLNWMENKNTCYYVRVQSQPHGNEIFSNQGAGLRAAIDAAIAAEKGKE